MRGLEILERIFHVPGFDAAFGHYLGLDRSLLGRGIGRLRLCTGGLRQLQGGADAVRQFEVIAFHDPLEKRHGVRAVVAVEIQKTELSGG